MSRRIPVCRNCTHDAHPGQTCTHCGCKNHKSPRRSKHRLVMPPLTDSNLVKIDVEGTGPAVNPLKQAGLALESAAEALHLASKALIAAGKAATSSWSAGPAPVSMLATRTPPTQPAKKTKAKDNGREERALVVETARMALSACERAVLEVLVSRAPKTTTRVQAAILSGYSQGSGSFAKALANLRAGKLMDGDAEGLYATAAGAGIAGPVERVPTGRQALDFWYRKLDKCAASILEALVRTYPGAMARDLLAKVAGEIAGGEPYSPNSGSFAKALATLRKLDLIDGFKASDALMEVVRA